MVKGAPSTRVDVAAASWIGSLWFRVQVQINGRRTSCSLEV